MAASAGFPLLPEQPPSWGTSPIMPDVPPESTHQNPLCTDSLWGVDNPIVGFDFGYSSLRGDRPTRWILDSASVCFFRASAAS